MAERDPYHRWAHGRAPAALSADLFAGKLVIFRDLASVRALRERACQIVEAEFGADDPQRTEARLDADDFRQATTRARQRVRTDEAIDACWRAVLDDAGYRAPEVYRDRIRLRVVPSRPAAQGRFARPLPAHRDSWGSGIAAQINWWLPLYALSESRTMRIWPDLFATPVASTAAAWDYEMAKSGRHQGLSAAARSAGRAGQHCRHHDDRARHAFGVFGSASACQRQRPVRAHTLQSGHPHRLGR